VKGLELCRRYFQEVGLPALRQHFPDDVDRVACGLIGPGSDVFGFDDDISRDHNWGPRFWVVLSAPDYARVGEEMQSRLLAELPESYEGHSIREYPAGKGATRVRVLDTQELCQSSLGYPEVPADDVAWLGIAEHKLFELHAGEVWHDPAHLLGDLRERTAYFPEMVWRKRMAFWWEGLFFADNFVRSAARGDRVAEQLYLAWALFCLLRLTFMLNRQYAPYRKWLHRAFLELPLLGAEIDPLLTTMMERNSVAEKRDAFRGALEVLGRATNELGLVKPQPLADESACDEYGSGFNCYGFASAVQASITGPLSELAYHDGAPDQWAFDVGTAKPAQYPPIVRALYGEGAGADHS
jgi:hypothetical protein